MIKGLLTQTDQLVCEASETLAMCFPFEACVVKLSIKYTCCVQKKSTQTTHTGMV